MRGLHTANPGIVTDNSQKIPIIKTFRPLLCAFYPFMSSQTPN